MDYVRLEDFRRWKSDQILRLMEAADLTKQMMAAAERNDRLSFQLLLGEREEPIQQLWELEEKIQENLISLPREDAIRCSELLKGAAAEEPEEAVLCEQVAKYKRLLNAVISDDQKLSERMNGNKSFYRLLR